VLKYYENYLVDRSIVNSPRVRVGGARAKGLLDAGSLILRLVAFLPMAFLALGGAAATFTLRLPARIFGAPALGPWRGVSGVDTQGPG
jgi:hypothetical protein